MIAPLVLCYHALSDSWDHPMAVRPEALRDQMRLLLRRGFRPVTFTEAVRAPHGRALAVTLDDGFASTWSRALPVLAELGVPATAFLPSALLDGRPLAWDGFDPGPGVPPEELLPMGWNQVSDLVAAGWEVGAHSRTHPFLTRTDDVQLRAELAGAREEVEHRLGVPCRTLAYPFGDLDVRVQEAAAAAGYALAAALGPHRGRAGPLAVARVGVYRDDSLLRFRLKASAAMRSAGGTRAAAAGRTVARRLLRGG